ncbi:MAG: hypothetical protein R2737_10105 [Candidatus Nanopelagicales bacterium]
MTVMNLRCDGCDRLLGGPLPADADLVPGGVLGVRFAYHPGDVALQDSAGLACPDCWLRWTEGLQHREAGRCSACGAVCGRWEALHLRRSGADEHWRLCAPHAAEFLNRLGTVEPKLDPATFRMPFADREGPSS